MNITRVDGWHSPDVADRVFCQPLRHNIVNDPARSAGTYDIRRATVED